MSGDQAGVDGVRARTAPQADADPDTLTEPAAGSVPAAAAGPDGERLAGAAAQSALAQAVREQFSLEKAFGGALGFAETVVPLTLFTVCYGITADLRTSVVAALVPSVAFTVWRLARRQPLTQALSGIAAVGLGAFFALKTGRPENYFLPSILKNAGFAAAYALSVVVRWPLVGVVLGFGLGELTYWRSVPARYRVYALATWVWVGMFLVRLAVQIPLFLAERTTLLGLLMVPLGLPLFGIAAYLTWLLVRRVPVAHPPEDYDPTLNAAG